MKDNMSKYPIREEDNYFYEDDYHDLHIDGVDMIAYSIFGGIGLYVIWKIISLLMLYG